MIIRHGQWGDDFDITGGRGNGLFIESHSDIRGLNTGDQILQVHTFQYYFVYMYVAAYVLAPIKGRSDFFNASYLW